jgi:AP-3 complex subunit beta
VFLPHIGHFFVHKADAAEVGRLKVRVLSVLATAGSAGAVLSELALYAGSTDRGFAVVAVRAMGAAALADEALIPACLAALLRLVGWAAGVVLAEAVLVLAHLLRRRRGTDDEARALRQLCRKFAGVRDGGARAAVLSVVGDMHEVHPDVGPQLLRYVAQHFADETADVRLQALTLAAKLIAVGTDSEIPLYLLKVCERDSELDVRDRAKFLLALIENRSERIWSNLRTLMFPPRQEPNWSVGDRAPSQFQIGTLSQLFNRALGGYEPLPDWAPEEELPDSSLRAVGQTIGDGDFFTNGDSTSFESEEEEEEEGLYDYGEEDQDDDLDDFFV